MAEIERQWEEKKKKKRKSTKLVQILTDVEFDDDPGRDLGELGKPGHRFFFFADEIEALDAGP